MSAARPDGLPTGEQVFASEHAVRQRRRAQQAFLANDAVAVEIEGTQFHIRPLVARHIEKLAPMMDKAGDDPAVALQLAAQVACLCMCEHDGDRLWDDGDEDRLLEAIPGRLTAILEEVMKISGFGDAEIAGGN